MLRVWCLVTIVDVWLINSQGVVQHPYLVGKHHLAIVLEAHWCAFVLQPVELGQTAKLQKVSHNYYVIYHTDARTAPETPSTAAASQRADILARERAAQQERLKGHYMTEQVPRYVPNTTPNALTLSQVYYPERFLMPTQEYQIDIPEDYIVNMIIDPCRGKAADCCMGKYGTPE
jgi:hypothetical protein